MSGAKSIVGSDPSIVLWKITIIQYQLNLIKSWRIYNFCVNNRKMVLCKAAQSLSELTWATLLERFNSSNKSTPAHKALPKRVGFEGGIRVDVMMQPPLHSHVPVTQAVPNLHTEVSVVAVDVLDGSEVIFLFSGGIRTDQTEEDYIRKSTQTRRNTTSKDVSEQILTHPCLTIVVLVILYL